MDGVELEAGLELEAGAELGVDIKLVVGVGVALSVGFAVAPGPELPQPDTMLMTGAATIGSFADETVPTVRRFIVTPTSVTARTCRARGTGSS
jgi:hypothetical protein